MKTRVEYIKEIVEILKERGYNSRNDAFKVVKQSNGLVLPYEVDRLILLLDRYSLHCNVYIFEMYEDLDYTRFSRLYDLLKTKELTQAEKVHLSTAALRL